MSEWFKKAFGEDYLSLYSHRDAAEAARVIDLILEVVRIKPGAIVMDSPCGAGRHLQVFQSRGYKAFGLDLSMPLLLASRDIGVIPGTTVRADLRFLPVMKGSCDLVVNLFSSLGYFEGEEQNLQVISELVSLCKPGGWIVVDFMHSDFVRANLREASKRVTAGGSTVHETRWITEGVPRVKKETIVHHPNGREEQFEESVRLFSPQELRDALESAGAVVERQFGSYLGTAFDSKSERVILMGRRR